MVNTTTYFACEQPERPPEPGVTFFHNPDGVPCPGCVRAVEIFAVMYPEHIASSVGRPIPVADFVGVIKGERA